MKLTSALGATASSDFVSNLFLFTSPGFQVNRRILRNCRRGDRCIRLLRSFLFLPGYFTAWVSLKVADCRDLAARRLQFLPISVPTVMIPSHLGYIAKNSNNVVAVKERCVCAGIHPKECDQRNTVW